MEEEVARRLERYLETELATLLKSREKEFNAEIERRVKAEKQAMVQRRKEAAERKAREEEERKLRKEVIFKSLILIICIYSLRNCFFMLLLFLCVIKFLRIAISSLAK